MLKYFVILFVFILGFSTSNAQYLEFNNFIKLLDIAESREEVHKYLILNGFEFKNLDYIIDEEDDEDDTTHFKVDYFKKMANDEYFIRVIGDTEEDIYTIMEFSDNEDRSMYFASVLAAEGLEPVDQWEKRDGSEGFEFETDDYMMTISKVPDEDESIRYHFYISSY